MSKPQGDPRDIWTAEGCYYSKGHHERERFCGAVSFRYGVYIRDHQVRHGYARWTPPGLDDGERTFMPCEPGPGAFPITYWEA